MSEKEVVEPVNLNSFTKSELEEFFNQFDVICTDCDGVLWFDSATKLFPHSTDFINLMLDSTKRVYFITNNTTTSRESLLEKSNNFGFNVSLETITTPQHTIAQHLKKIGFNKKVYVIGFEQVGKELDAVGIENIGVGQDVLEPSLVEYMQTKYKLEENVGAVVVGIDPHFSLPKMMKAINYLRDPEVLFFSTNSDDRLDFPNFWFPESSIVAAIETASRRKSTVMGKTSSAVCDLIAETSKPINNQKTLMIGDRIDVDIMFGKKCGMKTLLVLSGMDQLKDVDEAKNKTKEQGDGCELKNMIPDYFASGIEDLFKILKS